MAIFGVLNALCAWELMSSDQYGTWRVPDITAAFVFAYSSLFYFFRLIWTLGENPIQSFMSAGTVHAVSFITVIILVSGSTFGFIWMVSKRLEHELTQLASLDPLTKILNRRGIENLAAREFSKMGRTESELAIVLMDIDGFKHLNDSFGHDAGDTVLKSVAKLLQQNLRPYDILGRLGGDELILLLPDTELDKALTIVERLRKLIEDHSIALDEHTIRITASFGVVTTTSQPNALEELLPDADKALYQSKNQGGNKVTCFPQDDE
jgi:diguanylate cyclase (GGDEF)-like protein